MTRWLANLPVRWKVLIAPAFLVLVLAAIGAYALMMQGASQAAIDALIAGPVRQAELIADFNTAAWAAQTSLYQLTATAANETDQKKIADLAKRTATQVAAVSGKLSALDSLKGLNESTVARITQLKSIVADYNKQAKNVVDMADSDSGSALMFMTGAQRKFVEIDALASELTDSSKESRDNEIARTNRRLAEQGMVMIGALVAAIVLGCAFSFIVARIIARPFRGITRAVEQIAQGDLSVDLSGTQQRDEVGQIAAAVAAMAEQVRATVGDIRNAAREVTNASSEIAGSTTDLSQRTEEQAATLEQTAASMEQISATVRKNAENAAHARQSAVATQGIADKGGAVAAKAVEAMSRIEDSSRKVFDIIGVIDELARQTNLLALNAAVEAARAGEAGRGFAVVASEVRDLAQRSAQAAKDIKQLIARSGGEVREGVGLVNEAGGALNEIVGSIREVAALVGDIANASAEQSDGLEQIGRALNQLEEVTQRNSALVEENAATAQMLEQQAKAMDEQVAFFRTDAEAASAELPPEPASGAAASPPSAAADRSPSRGRRLAVAS